MKKVLYSWDLFSKLPAQLHRLARILWQVYPMYCSASDDKGTDISLWDCADFLSVSLLFTLNQLGALL